jgi:transposase
MKKRKTKNRYRISDELWEKVEPLIPKHPNTHRFGGGRPRVPDRQAMDGILFVLRTGCQWNALNETGICSSSTAHSRFQEWTQAGVFLKLWAMAMVVELEEGVKVVARIEGVDGSRPETITIGTPVGVEFLHRGEGENLTTFLAFRPL